MTYSPVCKRCGKEHFNFTSCEKAAEKAEKLRVQHYMQAGQVPWGAGLSFHSKPAPVRTTPMKLGGVTPPKEGS